MFGLRIKDRTGQHTNQFSLYFGPIFDDISHFQWIVAWDCFFCPIDDKECEEFDRIFENLEIAQEANFWSSKTPLIPALAPYVQDDWNDLFAFLNLPEDPSSWCKNYWFEPSRRRFVKETTEVAFLNVDGAYWEVLCNCGALLAKVKDGLANHPDLEVVEISHETCSGL